MRLRKSPAPRETAKQFMISITDASFDEADISSILAMMFSGNSTVSPI